MYFVVRVLALCVAVDAVQPRHGINSLTKEEFRKPHHGVREAKDGKVKAATCNNRVELNFTHDCITNGAPSVNNLGGLGPDKGVAEELRFARVAEYQGAKVDLVVTVMDQLVKEANSWDPPNDSGFSGCYGKVGYVNVKSGTQTRLKFSFKNRATGASVTLPSFTFGMLDIGGNGKEEITVTGYTSYTLRSGETNVVDHHNGTFVSCKKATSCQYPPAICPGSTCQTKYDNPNDPRHLTQLQMSAAIRFNFDTPTSNFSVVWGKKGVAESFPSRLFFAGEMINFPGSCTPPQARTNRDAQLPLSTGNNQAGSDSPVCPEYGPVERVPLDLSFDCRTKGRPTVNNLGGIGPDTGVPPNIRFSNVTTYNGRQIDVVVSTTDNVVRYPVSGNTPHDDGYSGCSSQVGYVSIQSGSVLNLTYTFKDHETNAKVTLPAFAVAVLDLGGDGGERVTVTGYSTTTVWSGGSNVINYHNGTFESCKKMSTCVYPAELCPGSQCPTTYPNPENSNEMTPLQRANAIRFNFDEPASSFTMTWGKKGPLQPWPSRFFVAGEYNIPQVCNRWAHSGSPSDAHPAPGKVAFMDKTGIFA